MESYSGQALNLQDVRVLDPSDPLGYKDINAPTSATVTVKIAGTATAATIFSDNLLTPQANPYNADSEGGFLFYAANGRYDVVIDNGLQTEAAILDIVIYDPLDLPTTLEIINGARATVTGDTIETSGFTTAGDGGKGSWIQNGVTGQTPSQTPEQLSDTLLNDGNGDQWSLIVNTSEIDLLALGVNFDLSLIAAVNGLAGKATILISKAYTTSGSSFSSINDISIKFIGQGALTLGNISDARILEFTSCNNVLIDNANIDGNRLNQSVVSGSSGQDAIRFQSCDDVTVKNSFITGAAGAAIRSRDTQNTKITGNKITDSGFIQIYCGPAGAGGVDTFGVTIEKNIIDWLTVSPSSITATSAISITNSGGSNKLDDINIIENTITTHPDNVADSICIGMGGASNYNVVRNKCVNGDLPISYANCTDGVVSKNKIFSDGSFGIEVGHGCKTSIVSFNIIDGLGGLGFGLTVNGIAAISEDIQFSENNVKNVLQGCSSAAASITARNKGISYLNNTISSAGKCITIKWVEDIKITGNKLNSNNLGTATIQLNECDDFDITANKFENSQSFAVQMFGAQVMTVTAGNVSGNKFSQLNAEASNYFKDSLFAGSTIDAGVTQLGNNKGPDYHDYTSKLMDWHGTGTPEGNDIGAIGSTFKRTDGGASTTFYVKESGTGNTGWTAK